MYSILVYIKKEQSQWVLCQFTKAVTCGDQENVCQCLWKIENKNITHIKSTQTSQSNRSVGTHRHNI